MFIHIIPSFGSTGYRVQLRYLSWLHIRPSWAHFFLRCCGPF